MVSVTKKLIEQGRIKKDELTVLSITGNGLKTREAIENSVGKILDDNQFPILGTQYKSIDLAEDRERFKNLLLKNNFKQAENGIAKSKNEAIRVSKSLGFPIVIRPSYVLGGRAMEIIHGEKQLEKYIEEAVKVSGNNPVLIDRFLSDAIEVDVDAISDGEKVFVAGIMEHIEEAGIHSGDSACSIPPYSLKKKIIKEIELQTTRLALSLNVIGLINIQFAVKNENIYVLEVNPRASRTVPFISKAVGIPIAKIAARIMTGEKLEKFNLEKRISNTFAIKEAVFPFNKEVEEFEKFVIEKYKNNLSANELNDVFLSI